MRTENIEFQSNGPNILGAGLVCLDIIRKKDEILYYSGGSCGNVTSALSFLGWNASVITGNYIDEAGRILSENLLNTSVEQIRVGNKYSETPRVIEHIFDSNLAKNDHSFSFVCPECERMLPKVKPLTNSQADQVSKSLREYDVFYSDRSAPGIKFLRDIFRKQKNWTVYEPNGARNLKSFFENAFNSNIVKFSYERIPSKIAKELRKLAQNSSIQLIVYTIGKKGLTYSYRKKDKKFSDWLHLRPQPSPIVIDSSGAGDWCTAGLLLGLLGNQRTLKGWLTKDEVLSALHYGQALAAISCSFIGGQGLIYADREYTYRNLYNKVDIRGLRKVKPSFVPKINRELICNTCLRTNE